MSVKELDVLLVLLTEKKRKMEQEEAETNLQVMRDFLHCLRKQKLEEMNEVFQSFYQFCLIHVICSGFDDNYSTDCIM